MGNVFNDGLLKEFGSGHETHKHIEIALSNLPPYLEQNGLGFFVWFFVVVFCCLVLLLFLLMSLKFGWMGRHSFTLFGGFGVHLLETVLYIIVGRVSPPYLPLHLLPQ